MPHLFYINYYGIAESLQEPLLLSPINFGDHENDIKRKLDFVSRFIETYTVKRSFNYRKFSQASIKYSMYNLIKESRSLNLTDLGLIFQRELNEMEETWDGVLDFSMHQMNRGFVKHLLSRISSYVDNLIGKSTSYYTYADPAEGKPFEIEHIWVNRFEDYRDEFEQENEFNIWRNSIGALLLLPQGTNQSFNDDSYKAKLRHYFRENTWTQTLHPDFYDRNPNFLNNPKVRSLAFKPHPKFKCADLEDRQALVKRICEQLWSTDYFINQ
jgi:hypothetical protein